MDSSERAPDPSRASPKRPAEEASTDGVQVPTKKAKVEVTTAWSNMGLWAPPPVRHASLSAFARQHSASSSAIEGEEELDSRTASPERVVKKKTAKKPASKKTASASVKDGKDKKKAKPKPKETKDKEHKEKDKDKDKDVETKDDPEDESDNEVYCICRGHADDSETMVACDMCNEWFHTACVGIDEDMIELLDVYICPTCETKTARRTQYRTMCKRDECKRAARATSKFCSSRCAFTHAQSVLATVDKKELKDLRVLESYPSPSPPVVVELTDPSKPEPPTAKDNSSTVLDSIRAQLETVSNALTIVTKRQALLQAVVEQWEALAPAPAADEPKKKSKNKRRDAPSDGRPCGWDARLLWGDEVLDGWGGEFEPWHPSAYGEGDEEGGEAASPPYCTAGRRCERHAGWQRTLAVGLDVEATQLTRKKADLEVLAERIRRRGEAESASKRVREEVRAHVK